MTPLRLERLEVASGLVLGIGPRALPASVAVSPLAALEDAVRPALQRQPCLMSFSGGRDSSALLAVAAGLARREGHPLPVPISNRFVAAGAADESEWQERVVSHLRLDDWVRVEHDDDLDCVGPVATETLLRHGLLWPFNAYFHVPLLRRAVGGSLVTGLGGDELLAGTTWTHTRDALRNRRRVGLAEVVRVAFALAPRSVRRAVVRRHVRGAVPWLRDGARDSVGVQLAEQNASEPVGWSAHVEWRYRLRYLHVAAASLGVLADDAGVALVNPFLEPGFVGSVAALSRTRRFANRTAAMRGMFGGLLPDDVLTRKTKASFDEVFWSGHARTFAAGWAGGGVDLDLVDPDALRMEWQAERPDARSFLLAQAAWLADRAPLSPPSRAGAPSPPRGTPSAAGV